MQILLFASARWCARILVCWKCSTCIWWQITMLNWNLHKALRHHCHRRRRLHCTTARRFTNEKLYDMTKQQLKSKQQKILINDKSDFSALRSVLEMQFSSALDIWCSHPFIYHINFCGCRCVEVCLHSYNSIKVCEIIKHTVLWSEPASEQA